MILIIDPGKGWGHFVSKMYCYQKLAEHLNSKIVFLTKKSTQATHYLKSSDFCEDVVYLEEPKKGFKNIFKNIKSLFKNIENINKFSFEACYVFHPSIRYLLIAYLSKIKKIWGLGLKFQNFFIKKENKLYPSFFSKTIKNDNETLEFIYKITHSTNVPFKPLYSMKHNLRDTIGIIIAASGDEKKWPIKNYLEVISFLKEKNYKKFVIISGLDQLKEEAIIKEKFEDSIKIIYTSDKQIKDIIPYLNKCDFCIGNDTGFSHLSINLDIETIVIYGDCPPQYYSKLINHIDIDPAITRSSVSIHTIKTKNVLNKLSTFLIRRDGRVV